MDKCDKVQGTIILFLLLVSLASSEDSCAVQKLTEGLEYSSLEANLWIKPESDFERIEIHIKVNNILTFSPPYYHHKHLAIESDSILDSSYEEEPYWIPLAIKVYEEVLIFGKERLVLSASVNKTMTFELDDNLLCSRYRYQNYKLLAKGGLSYSRCSPSTFATEAPTVSNTISDSSLSNGNSTTTNKGKDENIYIITPADTQKKDSDSLMIIILIVIAILSIILIAAIVFIEWRNKVKQK